MTLTDFVRNGISSLTTTTTVSRPERDPPRHIPRQADLIADFFDTDDTVWMVFFDAGRYDVFDQLYAEYFDGELRRAYNGGVAYTGDWALQHLTRDFGNRGLFSWVPLRGLQDVEYDGRHWFADAPDFVTDIAVNKRLAALGYAEFDGDADLRASTEEVNQAVRDHRDGLDGGVIRYLKPHPPFKDLPEVTSESAKTRAALESGDLSYAELVAAYVATYRVAFEHARKLLPDLEGRVVITSDHGTCLTCGQLFHGRRLKKHDHLTVVPWFEVEGVV